MPFHPPFGPWPAQPPGDVSGPVGSHPFERGMGRRNVLQASLASVLALGLSGRQAWAVPGDTRSDAQSDSALFWQLLAQGGCVALMVHTATQSPQDSSGPPSLRDCASQPGLSDGGRAHARAWGSAFVEQRVPWADVRTSARCAARDTARLAFGRYRVWSPLNAVPQADEAALRAETADVLRYVLSLRTTRNAVLVTHVENVGQLTGVRPVPGDVWLVRPEGQNGLPLAVLARRNAP